MFPKRYFPLTHLFWPIYYWNVLIGEYTGIQFELGLVCDTFVLDYNRPVFELEEKPNTFILER